MPRFSRVTNGILFGAVATVLGFVAVFLQQFRGTPDLVIDLSGDRGSLWEGHICADLQRSLSDKVLSRFDSAYHQSRLAYYSRQEREITPRCIVQPHDTDDVATAVRILKREYDQRQPDVSSPLHFAVRSGGHGLEAVANVEDGVVLDMSHVNEVTVSDDRATTVIGAGNRWREVSSKLDSMGLAVAGGRNSNVGVGGLILGGGISFFSSQVGFVCTNVLKYEVVLANGTIVDASESKNADLWRALKGGSNNFGIVTRFTTRTFPFTRVWGGYLYHAISTAPRMLQAFHDLVASEPYDEHASGPIMAFSYVQKLGLQIIATNIIYTKPEEWPQAWQGFKKIWRLWSTVKVQTLTSATDELDRVTRKGERQYQMQTIVKNDMETLNDAYAISVKHLNDLRYADGLIWNFIVQPLPVSVMSKGGVNSLGLSDRNTSLVIIYVTGSWRRPEDEPQIRKVAHSLISEVEVMAKKRGTLDPFLYLNYAAAEQDPISTYGQANKQFMLEVSREYDPDQLFQRSCIGGFKLDAGKLLGDS